MGTARENGEFELILGNKQLLSVLFIVIVLLGVFFAMGFLAGRSTANPAPVNTARNTPAAPLDLSDTAAGKAVPPAREAKEGKDLVSPEEKAEPRKAEAEVKEPPRQEKKKEEPPKAEPRKEEPKKEPARPARVAPGGGFTEKPPAGSYLQVAAARRADADNLQALLAKQGLPGYVTPVPNKAELFRVVVGPLNGNEQIAAAREKLRSAGITNGYLLRY
jgi:cell division protein FtsN